MDEIDENSADAFRDDCNCLPACTSIEYSGNINHIKYDLEVLQKSDGVSKLKWEMMNWMQYELMKYFANYNCSSSRPSRLAIYFRSTDVVVMKSAEKYNFTNFLSNCGGLLGLFLGVSLLSMIEFIYFFTLRLYWTIRRSTSENVVTQVVGINWSL